MRSKTWAHYANTVLASLFAGLVTDRRPGSMRWRSNIEVVVEEVAAELGGEDPLKPLSCELLERSKADLTYLNQFLEVQDTAVELQEPDGAELANLRARGRGQCLVTPVLGAA